MAGESGKTKYSVTEQEVFPGISLLYLSSHVQEAVLNRPEASKKVMEIFHCREGQMECGVEADYCAHVYCERWASGTDIERLTVAG